MSEFVMTNPQATANLVIDLLRQLPAIERLKVISTVLPEAEHELEEQFAPQTVSKRESLRGLWKHFNIDLSAEDIDEVRKEVWKNFPREDIV
jgi:hypothetical protein